ncbi:MAG: alpha/beta fold hydrolase [Myxococcota bacterium]
MIVLIPGIRGDPSEFARLLPILPEARAVAIPDDAGDRLSTVAARLLAELPDEPIDVVGASFGGLVGWAMPAARVRTLTTIGTVPWRTPRAARCAWAARALRVLPDRVYAEVYGPRARAAMREDGADERLMEEVRVPPRRALADRLAAIAAWGLPPRPPAPGRWLWGATDRFVTWDEGDVRARGMEPMALPGGHRPHLSHPSEVARWLPA